jgi:hypothetical protein
MNPLRRLLSSIVRHRALPRLILLILPLIVAACTNGGGSGSGY